MDKKVMNDTAISDTIYYLPNRIVVEIATREMVLHVIPYVYVLKIKKKKHSSIKVPMRNGILIQLAAIKHMDVDMVMSTGKFCDVYSELVSQSLRSPALEKALRGILYDLRDEIESLIIECKKVLNKKEFEDTGLYLDE